MVLAIIGTLSLHHERESAHAAEADEAVPLVGTHKTPIERDMNNKHRKLLLVQRSA
jgi:hypothetical protein